jgi:hypothetical protein
MYLSVIPTLSRSLPRSRLLTIASIMLVAVVLARPTSSQEIPEICTTCYEGFVSGFQFHVFDDWQGFESAYDATGGVHISTAYRGSCDIPETETPHQCCDPGGVN